MHKQASEYTDDEINELAEWIESLRIEQIFFLKLQYEAMLNAQAQGCGSDYVQ